MKHLGLTLALLGGIFAGARTLTPANATITHLQPNITLNRASMQGGALDLHVAVVRDDTARRLGRPVTFTLLVFGRAESRDRRA